MRAIGPVLCLAASLALPARGSEPSFDILEKTIPELQEAMRSGQATSRQLVELYRARIDAYDHRGPRLNAIVALNANARAEAEALDHERAAKGARGPLHGIPIVVKDNYETVGMPTAAGSIALAGYQSTTDAYLVHRLREAGAVIIGKTNMHELASGITNLSSLAGQTRNPYELGRYPGGSSGGTGAAVAASFAAAGLGSDTCGSIRIPASSNNLVGLRGTRGLVSRSGIVPLSHTQDIAGPLARTLGDLAIMLDATVGVDAADATTAAATGHIPTSYALALKPGGLKGVRLGVLKLYFGEDEDGSAVVSKAIEEMKKEGAEVVDVDVPGLRELLRDSSLIDMEFTPDLAAFLAAREGAPVRSLEEIVKRGLYDASMEARLATHLKAPRPGSEEYRRALVKRDAIGSAVTAAMDEQRLAALVYPTIRRKPARIGDPQPGTNCLLSSTSGLPALSVPAGFTEDGLPIGVEFLGRAWSESDLLGVGYAWEQASKLRRVPFSTPALVDGKAPSPVLFAASNAELHGRFTYEPTTGELQFSVTVASPASLWLVALHRAGEGESGPIVARLVEAGGSRGSGTVPLGHRDREALLDGRLYVQVHAGTSPSAPMRLPLRLPSK